jgi:hypothetical protein
VCTVCLPVITGLFSYHRSKTTHRLVKKSRGTGSFHEKKRVQGQALLPGETLRNVEERCEHNLVSSKHIKTVSKVAF